MKSIQRGCLSVTAVDQNPRCIDFIRKTSVDLGIENLRTVRSNSFQILRNPSASFNLIFADPPYDLSGIDTIPDLVFGSAILKQGGLLILEHSSIHDFSLHPCFSQKRTYGSVNFSFFKSTEK